jgi:hypothetical protein
MKPLSPEDCEVAHNLLLIKGEARSGKLSEKDIALCRASLERSDDLALIAAGYALSEGIGIVREASVNVIQKAVVQFATFGSLPSGWVQLAIFEGLSCSDNAVLVPVREPLADFVNLLRLASIIDPICLDSFEQRLNTLPRML